MSVFHELVALLERFGRCAALPKVRALHLPPAAVADPRHGEFCALELEDGSLGLAYVLLDGTREALAAGDVLQRLAGADPLALARRGAAAAGVDRALGFAAANALTRCLFDRAGYRPDPDTDSLGGLDPQPGDHIGMVGLFPPLVGRIAQAGARLTVVELRPELAGERNGCRVTLDADELRACNKVLATSTLLLNDTVERILERCAGAVSVVVIGPGAGGLPDPLFARGVTRLGGAWVLDGAALRRALVSGSPWGASTRKFALRPADYPGFEALVARASSG